MERLKICNLFSNISEHTIAADIFEGKEFPWEVLSEIKDYIIKLGKSLDKNEFEEIEENIWIHKNAKIAKTACLNAPLIVDDGAEIRHCAFVRGSAIVGKGAVVGNSTELKNVILFDKAQVPHYNYVGDSIIGFKSHMGAGSITSNLKSDKSLVTIKIDDNKVETGLKKMGAVLGDEVEVGCNSVLNPGTVIGDHSNVYPLSMVRGFIAANSIYKKQGEVIKKNN